jgi:hypothetical protein
MTNYSIFASFLANYDNSVLDISFAEIEEKIGKLPSSAYQYAAWWSNSPSHPLMKHVLNSGWLKKELALSKKKVKFVKFSEKEIQSFPKEEKRKITNIMPDWAKFEAEARKSIEKELSLELPPGSVSINGKRKNFDLINEKNNVVGDIKNYKMTKSGLNPSAKFSAINEYVWEMQLLEKYSNKKWKKILVIGEDLEMVKKYVKTFDSWLDDIQIYFYSKANLKKIY